MDVPDCMKAEEIRMAMLDDGQICILSKLVLCGWPSTKAEVQNDIQPILVIQEIDCNHRHWCNERQNNNTCGTKRQGTQTAIPEPHGNKQMATGMQVHTLNQHECWQSGPHN